MTAAHPAQSLFGRGNKFSIVIDGWAIPATPETLFAAGKFMHVPLLAGTNADEGTIFLHQLAVKQVAGYHQALRNFFHDDADAVFQLFPAARDEEVPHAMEQVITVAAFVEPTRELARQFRNARMPVYLYQFSRVPLVTRLQGVGACHGIEIPFVFDTLPEKYAPDEIDRQLARTMGACWVRFAKTGNPNGTGIPNWPALDAQHDNYLRFGDTITVENMLDREACDLLEQVRAHHQTEAVAGE